MNKNAFEILHFSQRKWKSYHEEGCYLINLVLRVQDTEEYYSIKDLFLNHANQWRPTEIVTDIQLAEKYLTGLKVVHKYTQKDLFDEWENEKDEDSETTYPIEILNEEGINREDVYIKGYEHNLSPFLVYNEKFDVFRFHEFFVINSITDGIIKYIKELQELENKDDYYAHQLLRAIESLEYWWD